MGQVKNSYVTTSEGAKVLEVLLSEVVTSLYHNLDTLHGPVSSNTQTHIYICYNGNISSHSGKSKSKSWTPEVAYPYRIQTTNCDFMEQILIDPFELNYVPRESMFCQLQ